MNNKRVTNQKCRANSSMEYAEIDPSRRYGRFKEILGKGAMKIVYRAFDVVLGMEVAWNQVMLNDVLRSPDDLQRLYSEVHLLKDLNHESIIKFYHSWIDIDHKTFNFITEMFTSGTLREYRKKYSQVDIRAIKNWSRQILRGLTYLHSHDPPVIHRDLKCDNIFVNGHLGQVKIGDLGLATILRGSRHAHSVIGTPEFMAPELYEEEYDELVDVYSFGMCVLEMLTSEYPYSECSNPAQIYKKVISGKKPEAFYRIRDAEARLFVGKCLENASKRLPAHQLLMDPFLAVDEDLSLASSSSLQIYSPKGIIVEMPSIMDGNRRTTDMTITGKMNPEDNTLFLKVQISDKEGHVRNVRFPFDIVNDTAMDVALEMVNELDLSDWDPHEISEMIEQEISALVPGWKDLGSSVENRQQHSFDYVVDDDDENNPPYLSSCSPSNGSLNGVSDSIDALFSHELNHSSLQGYVPNSEDVRSEGSYSSCTYSDLDHSLEKTDGYDSSSEGKVASPDLNQTENSISDYEGKCNALKAKSSSSLRKLSRVRSFMDIRTQLLQRSLMQALTKRRGAKTVGAVENIGFRDPSV